MKYKPRYLKESPEDKQIRMVLISMIASICLCMTCLVGTTWAWFAASIVTEGNAINIGELEVAVALIRGDQADRESITPSDQYTYELDEVGTYSITLINSGSISGFCTVVLTDNHGNVESFSTGTLYPAGEDLEDSATIELTVTPEDNINGILPVTLEIQPHWGEDPAYTIADIDEDVFVPTEETTEPTEVSTEPIDSGAGAIPEETETVVVETTGETTPEATEETTGETTPEVTEEATEESTPETTETK